MRGPAAWDCRSWSGGSGRQVAPTRWVSLPCCGVAPADFPPPPSPLAAQQVSYYTNEVNFRTE